MKVKYLERLSIGSPTQWAGHLENEGTGRPDAIYVMYSFGELVISVNDVIKKEVKYGDPNNSVLKFEELRTLGRDLFEWPEKEGKPVKIVLELSEEEIEPVKHALKDLPDILKRMV